MKSIYYFSLALCLANTGLGCNFIIDADTPAMNSPANDGDGEGGAEPTPLCGNGVLDVGEACDDGNTSEGDGCHNCEIDCGNGLAGEFKDLTTKHCFLLVETPAASWAEAQAQCEQWNGTLAVPTTLDEFGFIQNRIRTDTWIGGHRLQAGGIYEWVTGEPFEMFWQTGQMNPASVEGLSLPCLLIGGDYLNIISAECAESKAFVCERNE